MPAIVAGIIFVFGWVYLNHNPKVHCSKDKPAIVQEVK